MPAGPTAESVYCLVRSVKDHAGPQLPCQNGLFFTSEVPLLNFVWQAGKCERISRRKAGFEQGAAAEVDEVLRSTPVLSS